MYNFEKANGLAWADPFWESKEFNDFAEKFSTSLNNYWERNHLPVLASKQEIRDALEFNRSIDLMKFNLPENGDEITLWIAPELLDYEHLCAQLDYNFDWWNFRHGELTINAEVGATSKMYGNMDWGGKWPSDKLYDDIKWLINLCAIYPNNQSEERYHGDLPVEHERCDLCAPAPDGWYGTPDIIDMLDADGFIRDFKEPLERRIQSGKELERDFDDNMRVI